MPKCQFTTIYYDYETSKDVDFNCTEEEPLSSGFCIFHDKDYLQDKTNYEEHKRKVLARLRIKVNLAISKPKALLCIGFQLPEFILSDLSSYGNDFTKPVYFSGSQFFGKADFSGAKFKERAQFDKANFQGETVFQEANLEREADFSEANFEREAKFSKANLQESLYSKANFKGEADFSEANFKRGANFSEANFEGEADFIEANFEGRANFFVANLQKSVYYKANFKSVAFFFGTNFKRGANFSEANFEGKSDFTASKFEEVFFTNTNFKGEAVFFRVKFQEANFLGTNFEGKAIFNGSSFVGRTYFTHQFNNKINFNYVSFEGKEKVIFDIENLSNVSFMNTDLTGVRFSDKARWGESAKDRFKIVEEGLLEVKINEKDGHTTKDFNLGSIKAVYRNIRENYEYRMRYDEAGQLFIREMELKRKYREVVSPKDGGFEVEVKQNNWLRRNFSLTGLYYNLFVYGEDLKRPALVLLLPLLILSIVYWGTIDSSPSFNNDSLALWLNATERTLFDMSQIERKEPHLVDTTIKTLSLAILGTLLIPLRRRFERRFRH